MSRPRVILADDHPQTRALLHGLLATEFDVVGAVADGKALVEATELLAPDVVVTDIGMPAMDGISAASRILQSRPSTRVVFVSVHNERCVVKSALAAGGLGYVLKLAAGEDLIPAVHAALQGQSHISQSLRDSSELVSESETVLSECHVPAVRAVS